MIFFKNKTNTNNIKKQGIVTSIFKEITKYYIF